MLKRLSLNQGLANVRDSFFRRREIEMLAKRLLFWT